jgi:hypothetical protein
MTNRRLGAHDQSVLVSLVDTGRSTLKMLLEVWYALWHEAHH